MNALEMVDAVDEILAPVMSARGFGPGGPGRSSDGSRSFLFCVGESELASRWQRTVAAIRTHVEGDDVVPHACIDVVIELSPDDVVQRADFEFVALDRLLRDLGHHEVADRCALTALGLLPAREAIGHVRAAVETLLPLD